MAFWAVSVGRTSWFGIESFGRLPQKEVSHGLTGLSSSVRTVNFVGITVGYDFQYFLFAQHILFFAGKIRKVLYGYKHVLHCMRTLVVLNLMLPLLLVINFNILFFVIIL